MKKLAIGLFAAISLVSTNCFATLVTATGTGPDINQTISASADFQVLGGNQLQVTVANTYSGTTFGIAETLYGVYFSGASGLSLVSATALAGQVTWDLNALPKNTTLASDMNLSGYWKNSTFGGQSGASALGGGNQSYGLVSSGFNGTVTDGLGNANHNPYLQNSIVLLFNYTSLSDISSVKFTYGTASETVITSRTPAIPEPSTVIAGALLLIPLGVQTFRRLRK
jgi:hypothetical protein